MRSNIPLAFAAGFSLAVCASAAFATPIEGDRNYYEENSTVTCAPTKSCNVTFTKVDANKALRISQVSCSIRSGAHDVRFAALGSLVNQQVVRQQFLLPQFIAVPGGQGRYVVNSPALKNFEAGSVPAIRVATIDQASPTVACQIVGEIFEIVVAN